MLIRHFDATIGVSHDWRGVAGIGYVAPFLYDVGSLTWVPSTTGGGGVAENVSVTNWPSFATEATLAKIPGISIPLHDYIGMGYTGADMTSVVYKTGGVGGTTVATLTLAYSAGILQSVTKS